MDPLSITLAAVTLATALKDVIAIAQKIEKSFEKVSSLLSIRDNVAGFHFFSLIGFTEFADRAKAISGGSADLTATSRIL